MRKILCFILILCCLFGVVGCSGENAAPNSTVTVYYQREKPVYGTADGVIASTAMDASGHEKEYSYLLNQYLKTTPGSGFSETFPNGVILIGFTVEGLTAKVILSDRIADLSGMKLTIALTCLTQTILSMTGCQEVIISAASKQLDGKNFVTLNQDSYLLLDNSGTPQN